MKLFSSLSPKHFPRLSAIPRTIVTVHLALRLDSGTVRCIWLWTPEHPVISFSMTFLRNKYWIWFTSSHKHESKPSTKSDAHWKFDNLWIWIYSCSCWASIGNLEHARNYDFRFPKTCIVCSSLSYFWWSQTNPPERAGEEGLCFKDVHLWNLSYLLSFQRKTLVTLIPFFSCMLIETWKERLRFL